VGGYHDIEGRGRGVNSLSLVIWRGRALSRAIGNDVSTSWSHKFDPHQHSFFIDTTPRPFVRTGTGHILQTDLHTYFISKSAFQSPSQLLRHTINRPVAADTSAMTSYFSSLLTTTTSRVASIRQNLLPTENDGDTEDDTHLCRVLRAYYTEKGRSFPAWLPPDPKAPPPVVVQPVYAQSSVGSRYGGLQNQPGGTSGGGLASLWDKQPQQQMQPQEQQSLRQGRGQGRMAASGRNPFASQNSAQAQPVIQSQPLPSQKGGSYQQTMFGRSDATPPGSSGGPAPMSSRQRLAAQFNNKPGTQRANSYESSGSAPPLTSANSPWSNSGGGGYEAGGYDAGGYDAAPRNSGRQGLPSGPAAGRRGPGLPSGPRGPR